MVAGVVRKGMLEDARRHPDDPAAQNVIAAYETFEHGWSEEARVASTALLAEATAHATIISETLESCWISRRFLRLRTGCTTL